MTKVEGEQGKKRTAMTTARELAGLRAELVAMASQLTEPSSCPFSRRSWLCSRAFVAAWNWRLGIMRRAVRTAQQAIGIGRALLLAGLCAPMRQQQCAARLPRNAAEHPPCSSLPPAGSFAGHLPCLPLAWRRAITSAPGHSRPLRPWEGIPRAQRPSQDHQL